MAGFDFDIARQALGGLARRQEAIANNIANAETPGYKRGTVDFESLLRQQLATQESALRNVSLAAPQGAGRPLQAGQIALKPLGGSTSGGAQAFLGQQMSGLASEGFGAAPRNDGNAVDLDQEMTDLATTQLQFAGLSTALATRLRTMRSVIESV